MLKWEERGVVMIYGASVLLIVFCLCVRSRSGKQNKEDQMFKDELQKIKNDVVLNFIDVNFLERNFEFFGNRNFALAANDEGVVHYPITDLQDLDPKGLA